MEKSGVRGRKRKRSPTPASRSTRARREGPATRGSSRASSSAPLQRGNSPEPSTSGTPTAPQRSTRSRRPLPRQPSPSALVQHSVSQAPQPSTSHSRRYVDLPGGGRLSTGTPVWLHVWDVSLFLEMVGPILPNMHNMDEEVWRYVSGPDTMMVTPPWTSDSTLQEVQETLAPFPRPFTAFSSELMPQPTISNDRGKRANISPPPSPPTSAPA
ncbi:hypothetical protein WMY93_021450 [Mugilogobius chulae]|uniref:Uncharacterized protein n=1 Tax=Mugilogobius chulae TaxID=88201 RepID=A0AAW0NDZ1_9GOBI